MATYIVFINWTDQGIRAVKGAPKRLEDGKKAIEAAGGKMISYYLTMGRYDGVFVFEFPNDEVAATWALDTGRQGNIRTETLKAFPEDEALKIFSKLQ
jgi:uncharacterized protein with GYD domain